MNHSKSKGRTNNSGQRTKFYLEQFDPEASKKLKILIAKFLDKKGVIPWQDEQGKWIRPSALSALDREALARSFVTERLQVDSISALESKGFALVTPMTFEEFLIEIAKHIDLRLPYHYYIHLRRSLGATADVKKMYPGVDCLKGVTFKYRVNYILDLRYAEKLKLQREAAQLQQLKALAARKGLTLKRHVLNAQEVSELVDALLHQRLSDAQQKTYFVADNLYHSQAKIEFDEFYA